MHASKNDDPSRTDPAFVLRPHDGGRGCDSLPDFERMGRLGWMSAMHRLGCRGRRGNKRGARWLVGKSGREVEEKGEVGGLNSEVVGLKDEIG